MSATDTEPATTLRSAPPQRTVPVPPRELLFTYALEESVSLALPAEDRHLERWKVTVANGDTEQGERGPTIGDAHVIIVRLEAGRDVRDFADVASGEWHDIERPAGQQRPSAEPDGVATAGRVLVLERVWVTPAYRGHGLGPTIAAAVIGRLGRGCRLAACFPAPFEGDCRPEDRGAEIEALGRIWAKVGFRPWRDGVWMMRLDPVSC